MSKKQPQEKNHLSPDNSSVQTVESDVAQKKRETISHFNREHAATTGVALAYRSGFKNIQRVLLHDVTVEGARFVVSCDSGACSEYFEVQFGVRNTNNSCDPIIAWQELTEIFFR